jgi:hypothetical protein
MRFTKKKVAAVAAGVLTLGLSVGAYAYWSTTGSGSGTATVGSSNGTVTLHATVAAPAIVPGEHRDVTFTADNAGATDLQVGTISLDSIDVDSGHATCDVSDFSMVAVSSNSTVLAGADHQTISGTGSLVYANSGSNQDACKGATLTLNLTSN